MVDEEAHDVSAAPAGAPPNRDSRRDPGIIEGEMTARATGEREPPASAPTPPESAVQPRPTPAAEAPRSGFRGVLAGALAGLIVSALAIGGFYSLLAPGADVDESANRLAEFEAQTERANTALDAEIKRESAALAGLDKRMSALETSAGTSDLAELGKRVAALEAASAENAPKAAVAVHAAEQAAQGDQQLATQLKDLRADIDAARSEIPGFAARLAKLEAGAPKVGDADLAALAGRLDKIEAALAAPKSETRVAAEKPAPADSASAIAIIAGAIEDKLADGAPFGTEVAALQRLGVDTAQLAALQAVAGGAPTGGALAAAFDAVAPQVLAAAAPAESGGVLDRLLAHIHGLVRVHVLSESAGDDPEALISRIEAACRRGDIAGALAAFDKLPAAAREAAGDWPVKARARQAADAALQSIREAAVGRLAGGDRP
jgi:hypothetical protein